MYIGLRVKYRYSCQIVMKLELCRQIFEKYSVSDFIKIRPVEAELFHADGRREMTKLVVAFRSVADVPKNERATN
jgi:hypothetical protein